MHQILPIDIIGGAYKGRSRNNIQELINMYVDYDTVGGEDKTELRGTPGLKEWFDFEESSEIRGFDIFQGKLWVVVGNTLYEVSGPSGAGGSKTSKGTLSTSAGKVQIHNNGTVVAVCDGQHVYSQSGSTLTQERTASYMTYQSGYFIIALPDTGSAMGSSDPTTWPGSANIVAEQSPDYIVSLISDHSELIILGQDSIEVQYLTGETDPLFAIVSGGYIEIGCIAKNSVVKMNNSVYFLDKDYNVRRLSGLQAQIVSTPAIQYQLSQLEDQQEAVAYQYSLEGHYFYIITFDESDVTYCFDETLQLWYKWSTGGYNKRHTTNCGIRFDGKNLAGDHSNGKIYEIDPDTRTDDGTSIYRERTTQYTTNKPSQTFFNKLILDIQTATVPGSEPEVMLDFSDDYGNTYSTEIIESLGASGEFTKPVEFAALGSAGSRVFRIRITDDCFVSIQNAQLIGGVGWY